MNLSKLVETSNSRMIDFYSAGSTIILSNTLLEVDLARSTHAGRAGQARGALTVVGGLGAVGSLAAAWAIQCRSWQDLKLLGRTGRASEQTLRTLLCYSKQVQPTFGLSAISLLRMQQALD